MNNELYINIPRTLSYNALWNFILGMRGGGKTYGTLKYAIEQYLKNKKKGIKWQFMYVRRMKTELEKLTIMRGGRLFKAVEKEFPECTFKAESNTLYCDGEIIGYAQ
ncbi:MAG: phage DNA encapsidation protein, partial [Prevotella sp.]|nr:phage DNA encapsidation protein [Prevotella sp.]